MTDLGNWQHVCVDMQRMFVEDTPWRLPWMERILPKVETVSEQHAERTLFTRFIPPRRPEDLRGDWRRFYEKWWMMTGDHLPGDLLSLVPPLQKLVPPGRIFDKQTYSPWFAPDFRAALLERRADTLVISGGETEVCVLATVLGAVDFGFHVIVLRDALCSFADRGHDAAEDVFKERFSVQIDLMDTDEFLALA